MRGGRWGQVVEMKQGAGEAMRLLPVHIKAEPYMVGIGWGKLGTPEEAVAKNELARMLQVYERFGATQQPLKYRDGRVVWSVAFPPNSRWLDGPEQPSAWLAMLENYVRNSRFKGYGAWGKPTDDGLRSLDKVLDDSLQKDQDHFNNLIGEVHDRHSAQSKP